ncbi:uncharacterized protein [Lolium perenne]|uniref:uncharacterized protein n=1 Tax=Lolium perenne TaxID=4522 RepID=UPI003A9998F0
MDSAPLPNLSTLSPEARVNYLAGLNIGFYVHHKLDLAGVNYSMWRQDMELAISLHGVEDHIAADFDNHEGDREWRRTQFVVKLWIYNTCTPVFKQLIMNTKATAFALWSTIETMFTGNVRSRKVKLLSDLHDLRQGHQSVAVYASDLQRIAHGLHDIGKPLDDEDLVVYFLCGLDKRHRTAGQLLEERTTAPTFASAQSTVQLDEDRLGGPRAAEPDTPTALYSSGSHGGQGSYGPPYGGGGQVSPSPTQGKQKRKRTDKHTGYTPVANASARPPLTGIVPVYAPPPGVAGPGVLGARPYAFTTLAPVQYGAPSPVQYDAPSPFAATPTAPHQFAPTPPYGTPSPYAAPSAFTMTAPSQHMQQPPPPQQQQQMTSPYNTSVEQAGLTQALHNLSINSSNSGWVADSGATSHMPAAHGNLASLTPVSNFPPVIVGNGSHLSVSHIGSSTIPTVARSLSVNDILVAPNIIQDLLSVRKLTRDNLISMEFDPWGLSLKDLRTKAHLLRTNSDGDLYPLLPQSTALLLTTQAASELWQRRLGHPGVSSFFRKLFPCLYASSVLG